MRLGGIRGGFYSTVEDVSTVSCVVLCAWIKHIMEYELFLRLRSKRIWASPMAKWRSRYTNDIIRIFEYEMSL